MNTLALESQIDSVDRHNEKEKLKRPKTIKIQKKPNILSKVIGQFGLKYENQQIMPQEELRRRKELAMNGWKKVRRMINMIRMATNLHSVVQQRKRFWSYENFLIYPHTRVKNAFICFQSGLLLHQLFIVPYRYAFSQVSVPEQMVVDMVLDCFFFLLMVPHFFYVYIQKGQYVTDFKSIAFKYVLGILRLEGSGLFLVDLICLYPYYLQNSVYWLRIFRYIQIFQALKGFKLFWTKLFRLFTSNINFTKSMTDILEFLLLLFLLAQCLACIWYYLGSQTNVHEGYDHTLNQDVYVNGWVTRRLMKLDPTADRQTHYITSLYWVFTTLTTLGYGDYFGLTTNELVFTMLVQFLGVFVFAYMMGNINILVEKLDDDHLEYLEIENEKLDQWLIKISRANEMRQFTGQFVSELQQRLNIYWQKDHSSLMNEFPFFHQMPFKIQSELIDFCFGDFINDFSTFYRGLEVPFIHGVVSSLYPKQFLVKNLQVNIISENVCPNEIYFIRKGQVAVTTNVGEKFLLLEEKSYFGDSLILFNLKSSNIYQTNSESVECMCINKDIFLQLCNTYPHSCKLLKHKAYIRRKYMHVIKQKYLKRQEDRRKEALEKLRGKSAVQLRQASVQEPSECSGVGEMQVEDQVLFKQAKQVSEKIESVKLALVGIERLIKQQLSQIKIDIEFITKYEEILENNDID